MKLGNGTIAAISTAPGMGAIGILRLSGPKTLEISSQFVYKNSKQLIPTYITANKKKAIYSDFCDPYQDGALLDRILFLFSESPNSFTGEDMAEFHFHGNPILLRQGLNLLYRAGARPAEPGEFTRRAFLNEKINLTEAEAIGRVIHSRSKFELELAQKNLFGELSRLSSRLRSELLGIKAECEAEIDFSTEDLTYESLEERKKRIERIRNLCESLLKKSSRADSLIGRSKVVLFGEPNVGKSSLMNRLLGRDRALISEIPGTTRDYITEDMNLSGIPIQLVDTAGVRETGDKIESMGIEQSLREAENANLKLFLLDASRNMDWEEFTNRNLDYLKTSLVIANKIDIADPSWNPTIFQEKIPGIEIHPISCKSGEGIEELISILENRLSGTDSADEFVILEDRHRFHFNSIADALGRAETLMDESAPAEIIIKEIDEAVREVGFINGEITNEEVLGRIFSVFCVGK